MKLTILFFILCAGVVTGGTPDSLDAGSGTTGITRPGDKEVVSNLVVTAEASLSGVRFLFHLDRPTDIRLDIFNAAGKSVHCGLYRYVRSGRKSITWQGLDSDNLHGGSGHYIYSFTVNGITRTALFVILQ